MKRGGLLHGELSKIVAELGHGQSIVIADYGLPIPAGAQLIDLAITPGTPAFLEVIRAVLAELAVESMMLANELKQTNPMLFEQVKQEVGADCKAVSHERLKVESERAIAFVRTGEWTPYANVILRAGVVF